MIPTPPFHANSVTSKSRKPAFKFVQRPWLFFNLLDRLAVDGDESAEDEISCLRNRTASLSNQTVKKVLEAAHAGGMKQCDFEEMARRLRPPRPREIVEPLRGTLWNHYMKRRSGGRMSSITMLEYLPALHEKGWISSEIAARCIELSLSVLIYVKSKGSRLAAAELFVRHFLKTRYNLDSRSIGWILRDSRSKYSDKNDYLEWLQDFPSHCLGMEKLGTFLSHQALKSDEFS